MGPPSDWALLARYLSGECSQDEKAKVEALIAADPEKGRLIASMRSVWETSDPQSGRSDTNRLWGELAQKAGIAPRAAPPPKPNRLGVVGRLLEWLQPHPTRLYGVAAVLLLVASLGYYVLATGIFPLHNQTTQWLTLAVDSGSRDQLSLSDGSQIRLDAGSTLRYPKSFGDDKRTVFLTGEGYFEIAPDVDRPFIVHANQAIVKVVGTKFNIRAWQTEERIAVAVAQGKVLLGSKETEAVEITRGQLSSLPQNGPPTPPRPVDIARHLGWMQRQVFFDNAPLHEILYQLERWYGVQFALEGTAIATEQLTLQIQAQSLDNILELISALTGLQYQRTGNLVHLKPGD